MPKTQDYQLTEEELKTLEKAIEHDRSPEVVERYIALRLLHLGLLSGVFMILKSLITSEPQ